MPLGAGQQITLRHNGQTLYQGTTTVSGQLQLFTLTSTLIPIALSSLSVTPTTVTGGASVRIAATVSRVPGAQITIPLSSSHPTTLPVPSWIIIPAGATTASVTATARSVPAGTTQSIAVVATYNGSRTATVTVAGPTPPPPTEPTINAYLDENGAPVGESAVAGSLVTIQGSGFGGAAGTLFWGTAPLGVQSWSETAITFRVPEPSPLGARPGTITLRRADGRQVVQLAFLSIADPNPDPLPTSGWFVDPEGSATGDGTRERPWSLEVAINGTHRTKTSGGGTVWLLPGTYRKSPNPEGLGFRCVVGGTADRPLVFRGVPGARVTIDGGWSFFSGSNHTWIWGVEILVSEGMPHGTTGSWPVGAPHGGVNFYGSVACKAINLVLRNNRQGASVWREAREAEVTGCVIFDNGWVGTDRAHGHAIYVQNDAGTTKLLRDNLLTARATRGWRDGRYTMHGYGESAQVTNITARRNFQYEQNDAWLLGAGAAPSGSGTGNTMSENWIYGVRVRAGRSAAQSLTFTNNVVADGQLELVGSGTLTNTGNLVAPPSARPTTPGVVLNVNPYESDRAHLMLIDWPRRGRVSVNLSEFGGAGRTVRVMEPTDLWGNPVWSGVPPLGGVELPVPNGAKAYVVFRVPALPGAAVREEAPVLPKLRRR